jgi:hypothetical protein
MKNYVYDSDGVEVKSRPRVRTWRNYNYRVDSKPEVNTPSPDDVHTFLYMSKNEGKLPPPDVAVPGMVLSMKEVYDRYATGRPVPTIESWYDQDEVDSSLPDFSRMTKMQIIDHIRDAQSKIDDYRSRKAAADAQAAAQAAAAREAEFVRLTEFEANHKSDSKG